MLPNFRNLDIGVTEEVNSYDTLKTVVTFTDSTGLEIEFHVQHNAWVKYSVNNQLKMDSHFEFDLVGEYKLRVKGKLNDTQVNESFITLGTPELWEEVSAFIPEGSICCPDTFINEETIRLMYKSWTNEHRLSTSYFRKEYVQNPNIKMQTLKAILNSPPGRTHRKDWDNLTQNKTRLYSYIFGDPSAYPKYAKQNAKDRWKEGKPALAKPDLLAKFVDKELAEDMLDTDFWPDLILLFLCKGDDHSKYKTHIQKYLPSEYLPSALSG